MNTAALVHIIDDDAALRVALSRLLTASGLQVRVYESGEAFLAADCSEEETGCILLDMNMPGLSGLQLQEHLVKQRSILPIVFLTGNGDIASSVKAIKAGAEDFLSKPIAKDDLLEAISRAVLRHQAASVQQADARELERRFKTLTAREQEVFGLVIQGKLNKQVAYELGNTERTVKAQRQAVMEKLDAGSVAELVQIGIALGLRGAK
jgi:FixJ family two-component response regulator